MNARDCAHHGRLRATALITGPPDFACGLVGQAETPRHRGSKGMRVSVERWHAHASTFGAQDSISCAVSALESHRHCGTVEGPDSLRSPRLAALFGLWWRTTLPRVKRGEVGFGVAILYEDASHAQQIKADLVAALTSYLRHDQLWRDLARTIGLHRLKCCRNARSVAMASR